MRLVATLALLLAAPLASGQPVSSDPGAVRVQLLGRSDLSRTSLEAVGARATVTVDGVVLGHAEPGTDVDLRRDGGQVAVTVGDARRSGREVTVDAPEVRLRAGRIDRRYPARLVAVVEDGQLRVVNHAPIEVYVASVVASELNFPEVEAAKAQAVLARTYALRRRGAQTHHDLFDDERSQVYRGLGTVTSTSQRAAQETAGQTLSYQGRLADAYYFSSSGGHTANNESLWNGAPIPYLRGVPDPYDTVAPDHAWRTTVPRQALLRTLSSRYGGSVRGLAVERRSRNGRVLAVRLDGGRRETITGSQLRQAVNQAGGSRTLRSTRFELSSDGDDFVFTGGGFGHGVGMSQFGAVGQARAGRSYREILAHYFLGTDVAGATPALMAQAAPSRPAQADASAAPSRPSALRTRYRPPSGNRWPTPRRLVQEAAPEAPPAAAAQPEVAAQPEPPARRRTAW